MARRRKRVRRRSTGRRRSGGWLKKLGIAGLVALPLLYFTFTVLFFSPFEEVQPPFAAMAPRDVDLYVRRERLDSDFSPFPELRIVEELRLSRAFQALGKSAWWQGQAWHGEITAALQQVADDTADAPLDLLADVLGQELVVVGRWPEGAPQGDTAACVMARLGFRGKLAVTALERGIALDDVFPGGSLEEVADLDMPGVVYNRIERPDQGPLFFARKTDLLVASLDEGLMLDVLRSVNGDPERNLGKSNLYLDRLPTGPGDPSTRFSGELVVDLESARKRFGWDDPGGSPGSEGEAAGPDAALNFLRSLFNTKALLKAIARLDVESTAFGLESYLELDAGVGGEPRGLRGTDSFSIPDRLNQVMARLPTDVAACVTMNVELRPLLKALSESFSPDLLQLVNSTLRDLSRYSPTWKVDNVDGLIHYLDRTLAGQITIAVRPRSNPAPKGVQPLPEIAIFAPVKNEQYWEDMAQALIVGSNPVLGVSRDTMMQQADGVGTRKWFSLPGEMAVPQISMILTDAGTNDAMVAVSTHDDFLREIVKAYIQHVPSWADEFAITRWIGTGAWRSRQRFPDIADDPGFFAGRRANAFMWADMAQLRAIINAYGEYVADNATTIDFVSARRAQRTELLTREYSQYARAGSEMPPEVEQELNERLDAEMTRLDDRRWRDEIPALVEAWLEQHTWMDPLDDMAIGLRYGTSDGMFAVHATTDQVR